jgi:two-component system LytT family response regulator
MRINENRYRILIVDDEQLSRLFIRRLISEFLTDSEILEAKNAVQAASILEEATIDFLFLDIQMPEISGLRLMDKFLHRDFEVVFVTAFNQYAIDAIKRGAADYILKPINKKEFKAMLDRLIVIRERKKHMVTISEIQQLEQQQYLSEKITVSYLGGVKFIAVAEIIYLKAKNSYTEIYQSGNIKTLVSKPISSFEQILNKSWFFRIHKSYIVNINYFSEYLHQEGCIVLHPDQLQLPLSRHRQKEFSEKINRHQFFLKP